MKNTLTKLQDLTLSEQKKIAQLVADVRDGKEPQGGKKNIHVKLENGLELLSIYGAKNEYDLAEYAIKSGLTRKEIQRIQESRFEVDTANGKKGCDSGWLRTVIGILSLQIQEQFK